MFDYFVDNVVHAVGFDRRERDCVLEPQKLFCGHGPNAVPAGARPCGITPYPVASRFPERIGDPGRHRDGICDPLADSQQPPNGQSPFSQG
jgi:hypothetical protein